MKIYKDNIERATTDNKMWRKILSTTPQQQLVLMNIPTGEEIGMERHHDTTQFIRVESGTGVAVIGRKRFLLKDGDAFVVPPGVKHNVISTHKLKIYTIYSPPQHKQNRMKKPQEA